MRRLLGAGGLMLLVQAVVVAEMSHRSVLDIVVGVVAGQIAVAAAAKLGKRLGGPRLGFAAALVLALLPLLGALYALGTYRHTFTHVALPQLVGVRDPWWFFLGAELAATAAIAPRVLLAPSGVVAAVVALAVWGTGPLHGIKLGLHETAWSITFLEWLFVAGVVGVARRSVSVALGLTGWVVFFVLRAASLGYAGAAFWRGLAPATPAIAVMICSLWLLVPRLRPAPAATRAH